MKKYKCEQCGKVFTRPQGLGIHRKMIHGLKPKHAVKYKKRKKGTEAVVARYCPNCGCRIDVIQKAMELTLASS